MNGTEREGCRGPLAPLPWSQSADTLLSSVLVSFQNMARRDFRHSVLEEMAQDPRSPGINMDVREDTEPRAHLRHILRTIAARPDPPEALESLCDALRSQAPWDGALPWLELTLIALTRSGPLPAEDLLEVIGSLRALSVAPRPEHLSRCLPVGKHLTLLTGDETLPEVMVRLTDRRGDGDGSALFSFLRALSTCSLPPAHEELAPLRALLDRLGVPMTSPGLSADGTAPGTDSSRLIIQVRLEAEDAEHIDGGRYRLQAAYYRQPLPSGPLQLIGSLGRTESFARSELIGAGSARLTRWTALAREVRGAARNTVRVEFLLPRSLLGHAAELWSAGASHRPLGHHHPVVVRSLERYIDAWLDVGPWRARWNHLQAQAQGADGDGDTLDHIGWPPLHVEEATELTQWLAGQPALACMGLDTPYDGLRPDVRAAVDDAMFTDGVPVLLWRRSSGNAAELMKVLREHSPRRLAELPAVVHQCRRSGRTAGATDVRNNITLLWDDPDCVDPEQDSSYVGMA